MTYEDLSGTAAALVSGARVFGKPDTGIGAQFSREGGATGSILGAIFAAGGFGRQRVGFSAWEPAVKGRGIVRSSSKFQFMTYRTS